jgi:Domain of unknown function (DUF1929)/Bacterial Ig domain/Putative Ig domain
MKKFIFINATRSFRTNTAEISNINRIFFRGFLTLFLVVAFTAFNVKIGFAAVNLGNTSVGSLLDSGSSNNINGSKITVTTAANVTSMSVYVSNIDASTTNRNFQLAIYTNSGNAPGTLVANSATGTLVANSWNTLPVTAALQANTSYWLMYNTNGRTDVINDMRYNVGASGVGAYKSSSTAFGTWPSTFTSVLTNAAYSLYATADTGTVGDAIPPTVSISAPTSGASISGVVTINATANDNASVPSIQFQFDSTNIGTLLTTSPYSISLNTSSYSNGSHTLTAIAKDASGNQTTSTPITVTIANALPLTITTASLSGGTVGSAYSSTLLLSGGTSPYVWTITSGSLPNGLSINAQTAAITGTPTVAGTYNFTVQAKDSNGAIATRPLSIVVVGVNQASTLGLSSIGSLLDSGSSNNINGSKITTSNAVNLTSMSVYVKTIDSSTANRSFQLAIYTNSGNVPGTLVASSATGTLVASSWNTLPISASLQANTSYWLMYNTNGRTDNVNDMSYNVGSGGMGAYKAGSVTFGSWPSAFGTAVLTNAVYSLYASSNSGPVGDTTPPTVSITVPNSGSSISGTTTISAVAADNSGVSPVVQFQIDSNNIGALVTAPPYSYSWDSALHANDSHTITAIAVDGAGNQTTSTPISITVANADVRSQVGEWSPLTSWPLIAINANLLKTGKVLVWDHENVVTGPLVWDPVTTEFTATPLVNDELFCSGQVNLADGRVFTAGGHKVGGSEDGIKSTYIYDPDANTWTKTGDMAYDRWYPGQTKLGDGRVVITSGQIVTGSFADTPEIYDPSTDLSTPIPSINTSQLKEGEYPANFHLPNGKILAISTEHGPVQLMSADASNWTNVNTTPVLFGSAVQYRPGKILMSGGGPALLGSSVKLSSVLDMNVSSPAWRNTAPMSFARYMHNLVMLPTGKVFAVGGATVTSGQSGSGTLPTEIWDPTTETWSTVASLNAPRVYHSTALLLPDGRVLAAGGGHNGPLPNQFSAQVYSPSYLFKGPRPIITAAPESVLYGASTFTVDSPDAADIASVALIANGSVTHSTDMNQFYMELPFTKASGQLSITAPQNGNQVPPGHYMLFIVDSTGVPSVAKIVKIGTTSTALAITSNSLSAGVLGATYSAALTSRGGTVPYIWSVTNGLLPNGLSLNGSTGSITGIPTAVGTFNFTIQVNDSSNGVASRNFSIVVGAAQASTIGLSTVGGSLDSGDSNSLNGSKVTTASGGSIVSMSVYVGNIDANTSNRNFQLAIYTNSGNAPGTLVASSVTGELAANSWNTLPISATLQANTSYWLMYNTNGRTDAFNNMYYNNGSNGQGVYSSGSVNFGAWPASFPAATLSTGVYSLHATFGP